MAYSLEDKKDMIALKNQLINGPLDKLKETYTSIEAYATFLDVLNITLHLEPEYFLLDDRIIEKASAILDSKRWEYRDPDFNTVINEIISRFNRLKNMPTKTKEQQKTNYINYQQDVRQVTFENHNDLLRGIANDAILMEDLTAGNIKELDILYFFSSTNFLAKTFPEFYLEDQRRIEITFKKLDEHAKKRWFWNYPEREFAKETIKNLQKVKAKEE